MNDKHILKFFIGLITLQLIVKVIKNIIKDERPISKHTYGMPSTRSAFIFYIITYFIINFKLQPITMIILWIGGFISVYTKYIMKEHNIKQLFIGGIIGSLYSYFISII